MAARQLRAFIEDGNIVNSVNLPRCEMPRTGGYRISVINRNIKNMVGQITAALAESWMQHRAHGQQQPRRVAYTMLDLTTAPDQAWASTAFLRSMEWYGSARCSENAMRPRPAQGLRRL